MLINLLEPYQNFIDDGDVRIGLSWSTGGMKRSISYVRMLFGEPISFDDLIRIRNTDVGVRALLYGALETSVDEFELIFPGEIDDTYKIAVFDGLMNYLPAPATQYGELDESYPDIRPPIDPDDGDPFDWPFMFVELKRLGFSVEEIDRLTWRNMDKILAQAFGLKQESEHWLLGG